MKISLFVTNKKPLDWFKVLDELNALETPFLLYNEVKKISKEVGIFNVDEMLLHFHSSGVLMWHDNHGLREVVVLDPVKYFVKPATRIVCDITPASADGRYHRQLIHDDCEKHHIKDFEQLQQERVISEELLRFMLMYSTELNERVHDQELHYDKLKNLMLKYSLLVVVTLKSNNNKFYAVPALLSTQSAGTKVDASKDYYDHTFFLHFKQVELLLG